MESYRNPQPLAEYTVVRQHIETLRQIPGLESSTFWVIPESNLSGHASLHVVVCSDMPNVRFMCEDTKKDAHGNKMAGFRTTENNKRMMATKLHASLDNDRLYLYDKFVSVGGRSRQDVRAAMFSQLRMFSRVVLPPLDPIKNMPKERITGKLRAGLKDDIMMSMLICNAMMSKFFADVAVYGDFV